MRKSSLVIFSTFLLVLTFSQIVLAQGGKLFDIGTYPGGTWSSARDINDFGVVVGSGSTPYANKHPLLVPLFGPNAGSWTDLGNLGMDVDDEATGVADTGLVVGYSGRTDGYVHAFAWTRRSGMSDLGVVSDLGHLYSQAIGTNRNGTLIVGWSSASYDWSEFGWGFTLPSVAVVWTPYFCKKGTFGLCWKIQALDQTGFEQYPYFYASSVNNRGQIVGGAWGDAGRVALLWTPSPAGGGWTVRQLSTTADLPMGWAINVNERGDVVGWAIAANWSYTAPVLWRSSSWRPTSFKPWKFEVLAPLTTPQWFNQANGINSAGDIVGGANDADGNEWATLSSVSSPGSVKLLGLPGTPGAGVRVNELGVAVGSYRSSGCGWCMAAVEIRPLHGDHQ